MNIERLQKYFGEQLLFCETLSTYLCGHGTLPSHLVNDNIFIADIGNGLELFKIGKTQKIRYQKSNNPIEKWGRAKQRILN